VALPPAGGGTSASTGHPGRGPGPTPQPSATHSRRCGATVTPCSYRARAPAAPTGSQSSAGPAGADGSSATPRTGEHTDAQPDSDALVAAGATVLPGVHPRRVTRGQPRRGARRIRRHPHPPLSHRPGNQAMTGTRTYRTELPHAATFATRGPGRTRPHVGCASTVTWVADPETPHAGDPVARGSVRQFGGRVGHRPPGHYRRSVPDSCHARYHWCVAVRRSSPRWRDAEGVAWAAGSHGSVTERGCGGDGADECR